MIEPLLQSCGHSLCQDCRDLLINRNCPECRHPCTQYTPNLIVRQLVWERFPKACKKKKDSLNHGWTVVHAAQDWSAGLKRKLIDYVEQPVRHLRNRITEGKNAVQPDPDPPIVQLPAPKRLACPAPNSEGMPSWNGYVSATLASPVISASMDMRLPGPMAHVLKMIMVKNNQLFIAFGQPIVSNSRSSHGGRGRVAPDFDDDYDDDE